MKYKNNQDPTLNLIQHPPLKRITGIIWDFLKEAIRLIVLIFYFL